MAQSELTNEEHEARAALMGCVYNSAFKYYYKDKTKGNHSKRFDVDTLEELSWQEIMKRWNEHDDNYD